MSVSCDYLVIIHRIFIDNKPKKGGVDIIIDYLLNNGNKVCLVEHPLEYAGSSIISYKSDIVKKINVVPGNVPFRWIAEIFVTAYFILKNFEPIPVCIAVDPLNVLQALVLRRFKRINKIYFHCVDYSKRRFKNFFLNNIYHYIYCLALNKSDICGVVSKRMMEQFSKIVKDKDKLFWIPNTPLFKECNIDFKKRNKYSVVTMSGRVDDKTNYNSIFNVLGRLKKDFPQMDFKIIAKIEDEEYVKELKMYIQDVGLQDRVHFLGFFPDPSGLRDILIDCGVGMTSYVFNRVGYYMEYADSLKIREFASYGLPIVADSICGTSLEAEEHRCGFVADSEEEVERTLRLLWSDDILYQEYCKNALEWARSNDKRKIMEGLLQKIYAS